MERIRRIGLAAALVGACALGVACGSDAPSPSGGRQAPTDTPAVAAAGTGGTVATTRATSRPAASAPAGAGQPATGTIDACRIVTQEELEAALGFPLRPGQGGTDAIGAAACTYQAQADQTSGTMPDVTVAIYRSRLAGTTYGVLREGTSPSATDVQGLADKAYVFIGSSTPDNREIQVLRGDVLFSITVSVILQPPVSMGGEEKRARLVALARTALGRL